MHQAYPLWKKYPNGLAYFQEIFFLLFQQWGPSKHLVDVLLAHLKKLPKYLEEFQSCFDKTPIPLLWRDLALEEIQTTPKFLQNLFNAFNETLDITESLKNQLLESIEASESTILSHIECVKTLPVDDDEFAWALGAAKFDNLLSLRKLPWTRKTLIKKGTKLFNSLYKRLLEIGKQINPNKTLSEVIQDFFKEDKVSNFQEMLEYTRSEAERAKEFIKSRNLATIPEEKLSIVETPPHLVQTISYAAYYEPPYFKRNKPGVYLITPGQNEQEFSLNTYTVISNTVVHKAYPGHHLDFVCNNKFSPVIRLLDSAMETVEVWAHYCEEMMLQEGFHKDSKKATFLILGGQLFRVIRVLLDIQLHCKQRKVEDAIQMLMDILQLSETEAKAEVLRYTCTPTYQLSYLVGKLLIEKLRDEVEERMGTIFNLKCFHNTLLKSGDLPYFLLKEYFEEKLKINRCRVIKDYITTFPNPLILEKGDMVKIEEKECEWPGWIWAIAKNRKSGWVPKNYLNIEGDKARMLIDNDATEITAIKGQEFIIEKEESGWVWIISRKGESGWIPLDNIELIDYILQFRVIKIKKRLISKNLCF